LAGAAEEVGATTFFGKEFLELAEAFTEVENEMDKDNNDLADEMSKVDVDDPEMPTPTEEGGGSASWTSWTKFRTNAVQMAQVLMGGIKLQEWEKEMFLFPKACRVCRLAELDMYDCHRCQGSTYCSAEHREADAERHAELCSELKYAMVLDNYESTISIAAPPVPSPIDETFRPEKFRDQDIKSYLMEQVEWSRTSTLYASNTSGTKKGKKKGKKAAASETETAAVDLDEMEFRFLSDRLSGSLTIVSACLGLEEMANGVGIGACRDLTIHIVGANVVEMLGIIKWEYLTHRLPALENCRIVFIGPELGEQGESENGECEGIGECQECTDRGKSLTYEVRPMTYHHYVQEGQEKGYYSMPDLVCAFNCGFHEFKDMPDRDEWAPSLKLLVEHPMVPLIFTSYTENEAALDLTSFKKQFSDGELAKLKFEVTGAKNSFRSHRPVRDFACDNNMDVFYANQFVTVVRGRGE